MRFMLAAAALLVSTAAAQASDLAETLQQLEEERQAAYVAGDRATLERHFAAEYVHTNLNGGRTTRSEELDFFAPGRFSVVNARVEDVKVHDYGKVATLIATVIWEGAEYKPAPSVVVDLSGAFSISRTYVRRDGRWQLALSHASRIPPATTDQ